LTSKDKKKDCLVFEESKEKSQSLNLYPEFDPAEEAF
jgi:hypothetical protein